MKPPIFAWFDRLRSSRGLVSAASLAVALLAIALVCTAASTSCAPPPDTSRVTDVLLPDYPTYKKFVDPYLQRRCGTIDCHGQPGRAYRLYGFSGLRPFDAGLISGLQPTTDAEVRSNFEAVVGFEPEEMSRLIATQGADPTRLLLLRKALRRERHKGGAAMAENDAGYRCVVAWLRLRTIRPTADGEAFETIPEGEREPFPARAQIDCNEAQSFP